MPTKTNISGFPEYLPQQQLAFNAIVGKIAHVYQSFGFAPLETAAVERVETLTSKGIDSKEVYALRRLNAEGESGDKDIALRFDLTVPLARYVAQNYSELTFPFRRYQVQPVWRGERAQKGRYRQFHQFDIDTVADGTLPLAADAEILAAAYTALSAILPKGGKFTMRINNRKLLQGLVELAGYTTPEQNYQAIKVVDDLEKIPLAEAKKRLAAVNPKAEGATLLNWLTQDRLENLTGLTGKAAEGLEELRQVLALAQTMAGKKASIVADLTIARGLDYYTGTVMETRLEDAPELGSICSGGRYDNLTESLSNRKLPGVGISIGLSRLAVWLMDQEPYKSQAAATAQVLVACQNEELLPQYTRLAAQLRKEGVRVEQALSAQKLGTQLKNADKRGIRWAVIANDEEIAAGKANLKNLQTGKQQTMPVAQLAAHIG